MHGQRAPPQISPGLCCHTVALAPSARVDLAGSTSISEFRQRGNTLAGYLPFLLLATISYAD
jgi:hypothetical protein